MEIVFRTKYGFFESLIMNFGSFEIPSFFQNYINDIFYEHLNTFCSVYIDNILIYKKKTYETRSIDYSEIAKNRFPIRHRQIRNFYQKN